MTVRELAKRNIKNKPHRTYSMMVLTAVICLVLFLSSFVILSLRNGIVSLSNRMGADVIVVPEGYDAKVTGAILRGEPNSFFLDASVLERVRNVEGVDYATPQFFIATLSAGCCSFPIQVIGIDVDSDFVVLPWLKTQVRFPIPKGGVIVGHNIVGNYKEEVRFFNRGFLVEGRLAQTGMGFDNSVFMPLEDARSLAEEFKKLLDYKDLDVRNSYSSVMVKVKPGYDSKAVKEAIGREFENEDAGKRVYALISKQMMSEVSGNMSGMVLYLYGQMILIYLLAFGVLSLVYSFSMKERKKEIATLRVMGASKRQIKTILFTEVLMINALGSLIGCIVGFVAAELFAPAIGISVGLPFLAPNFMVMLFMVFVAFVLGTVLGPLSSYFSIRKMLKTEAQLLLREND
ncbi:MAG: FtsX-like permease family protein [Bacillota bacterium]|nr:FtsX-like permease family protein [Bacillota bacterium]